MYGGVAGEAGRPVPLCRLRFCAELGFRVPLLSDLRHGPIPRTGHFGTVSEIKPSHTLHDRRG